MRYILEYMGRELKGTAARYSVNGSRASGPGSVIGAALINRSSLSRFGTQQFDLWTIPQLAHELNNSHFAWSIRHRHTAHDTPPTLHNRRHVAETRRTRQDDAEPADVEELGQVGRKQELRRLQKEQAYDVWIL